MVGGPHAEDMWSTVHRQHRLRKVSRVASPVWQMWVAGAALAVLSAAANLASPLYPAIQQALGMSDLTMAALYATFAAAAMPSLLLFGPAADAVGRKPVLAVGFACAFVGTALFAAGGDIASLFLGRLLLGVGLGMGTGAGIAVLVESSPARHPARGSTLTTLAFVGGTGAGPLLAGILAQRLPAPTTTPFAVMLGLLAMFGLLVLTLPGPVLPAGRRWRPTRPAVPPAVRQSFAIAGVTGFLGWAVVGIFLALLPSVAESVTAAPNPAVSGAVVGALLLCSALSHLGAPRLEPRAAQTIGLTALAIGMTLLVSSYLPMFVGGRALVLMAAAAVVCGLGHGISYWGAAREIDTLTLHRHRAGLTAALYLSFYAGAGIPAVGVGLVSLTVSLVTAIQVVSMVIVLCTVAFLPVPSLARTPVLNRAPDHPRRTPVHIPPVELEEQHRATALTG
jgi:predicted MFS family arabinose efflux permease